ncbi:MAG: alkaline phosphatase family protein [Parvularculaceae bacterium]|nr:alkaline phosphatase family protein [Parvularculaceae bacterium]
MSATKVNGGGRVIAICVDSMSLDFVRPHLDRLPALKSLLAAGSMKTLTTPADRLTASIWASFATGDGPGVHGHYYPFQWDPEAMAFARTSSPRWRERLGVSPFWHDLARAGVSTIAFDPGTPNDAGDAPHTEIINWCYQSSGAATATTPQLLSELRRRFGHRPIGKEVPVPKTLAHGRKIRDDLIEAIRRKGEAALWLMEREAWRFFLVGFYEVHRAGHNLLVVEGDYGSEADADALLAVYEAQDRAIAKILDKAQGADTTVVLFSLHGMVPNWSQEHFTDEIMVRLNDAWNVSRGAKPRPPRKPNLMSQLRAAIPARVQYSLAYLLGEHIQDWVVNRGITGGLDWPRTPAFRLASGGEGYIRLNIKGRERDGCLEPGEVAGYVKWLRERLLEIRIAETGAPLIKDLVETRTLHQGERTQFLPDLIVVYAPREPVSSIESPAIGRIDEHLGTGRGGNHSGEAFMIVTGPGAQSAALTEVRDIHEMRTFFETLLLGEDALKPVRRSAEKALADA